jgi:hypothetical protein
MRVRLEGAGICHRRSGRNAREAGTGWQNPARSLDDNFQDTGRGQNIGKGDIGEPGERITKLRFNWRLNWRLAVLTLLGLTCRNILRTGGILSEATNMVSSGVLSRRIGALRAQVRGTNAAGNLLTQVTAGA